MKEKDGHWYVAMIVLRFELEGEDTKNLNRRCTVYENLHLLKALTTEDAYEKAVKLGKEEVLEGHEFSDSKNRKGHWIFEGISLFALVDGPVEDGCVLFTNEHFCSLKNARKMICRKADLLS